MQGNNIHAHHRERLRNRFNLYGHQSFEAHNMLELMLFYGIPYKDTNPIAHNLLSRFGSIINVMKANTEELCEISGVGAHASEFLHCIDLASDIAVYDGLFSSKEKVRYQSSEALGEMLRRELCKTNEEALYAVMLNNRYELLKIEKLNHNRLYKIDNHALVNDAIVRGASSVVLAQYKENGIAIPYSEDVFAFSNLKNDFLSLGITLAEFFIVTERDYATVLNKTPTIYGGERLNSGVYTFNANDGLCERNSDITPDRDEFLNIDAILKAHETMRHIDRVQVLERLLSFTTRKPTRELSQALISRFCNLHDVVCAEEMALREMGVSDIALTLLRITGVLKKYLTEKYILPTLFVSDKERMLMMLSLLFLDEEQEGFILLMFDKLGKFRCIHRFSEGNTSTISITSKMAVERAILSGATSVIMAHNHPNGTATPSKNDALATEHLYKSLNHAGIELLTHYIISRTKFCEISPI